MPFKAYHLSPEGQLRVDLDEAETRAAFESNQGLLWVDVAETTEEDGEFLARTFDFHRLVVEDCVSEAIHAPKVDDFGDYLFLIVHGINYSVESEVVETTELDIFLGSHFVVTNHNSPLYSVESIRQQVEEDGRPMRRGAVFLAHSLIDRLIDNVMPTIDVMSDVTEEIEEEVVSNPQPATLQAILRLKRSTLRLHRVMAPQRELLNRLSRGDYRLISDEARIYYRDVYDHVVRIEDLNQSTREMADSTLATYLSSVANKQNEVMKVLSVVATIFLPLALLAGVYGMNFENMPELQWPWAYFALLGVMGSVIVAAMLWFWGRGWFTWGRRQVARVRPFAVEPSSLLGYLGRHPRRTGTQSS